MVAVAKVSSGEPIVRCTSLPRSSRRDDAFTTRVDQHTPCALERPKPRPKWSPSIMASTQMIRPGEIVRAAISRGDLARVRDLLRHGASANERGRHDTTALHWAASANETTIVVELLRHGANPNAVAADGCSPLHYAAREDAFESVAALIQGGADTNAKNNDGNTPLDEIYDETDEDGARSAALLRGGAGAEAPDSTTDISIKKSENANRDSNRRASSFVGAAAVVGIATPAASNWRSKSTSSFPSDGFEGELRRASDESLERAVEDMARLLKRKESASAAETIETESVSTTLHVPSTLRSASRGGALGDSGGRILSARAYVPAASHDSPKPASSWSRSIAVTLRPDGRLAESEYQKVKREYLAGFAGDAAAGDANASYERVPAAAVTKADERRAAHETGGRIPTLEL